MTAPRNGLLADVVEALDANLKHLETLHVMPPVATLSLQTRSVLSRLRTATAGDDAELVKRLRTVCEPEYPANMFRPLMLASADRLEAQSLARDAEWNAAVEAAEAKLRAAVKRESSGACCDNCNCQGVVQGIGAIRSLTRQPQEGK